LKLPEKKEKVIGTVVEKINWFYVVEESGEEYKLYAIKPQEAVAPDYNIGKFAKFVGKEVIAQGQIESSEIWDAYLVEVGKEEDETELGGLEGL
jgi:hypothetical protein